MCPMAVLFVFKGGAATCPSDALFVFEAEPVVHFTADFGKIDTEKYNERFHCSFCFRFVRLAALKRQLTSHDPAVCRPLPALCSNLCRKTLNRQKKSTNIEKWLFLVPVLPKLAQKMTIGATAAEIVFARVKGDYRFVLSAVGK